MKKVNSIKNTLEQLKKDSNTFEYNEAGILSEYKKQKDNHTNIAIKILSVFGGLMGTISLIGFLFLTGMYSSAIVMAFTGILFIVFSIFLNKKSEIILTDTFSISLYIIGIILLSFGLEEFRVNENIIFLIILCIGITSFLLTNNYILSFISVLTVTGSLIILLVFLNKTYDLIHLYNILIILAMLFVFIGESKIILFSKISKSFKPLQIGLVISFLFSLVFFSLRHFNKVETNWVWFYSAILIAANIFVIYQIINTLKLQKQQTKTILYILSLLILGATAVSPSILGAILLILLSFYTNYKIGLVLGILGLIYFVSQFYYDLHFTLLIKSILLFVSGILFIVFYFLITKSINNEKI